ncbi:MAG: DUF29 family protein [Gammaproteobacteria bacterium]|jgi:hypothetical protein|nr:DUF29 family protein [Gammaproteobacteria bacterium]
MSLLRQKHHHADECDLYERDYYRWLSQNAAWLRQGRLSEIDAEHLAEELEDMGRSEARALASHFSVLMLHLLKWQYQPDQRSSSWRGSIFNARRAIAKLLRDSPSLRRRLADLILDEYPDARFNAANETGLDEQLFPEECPYALADLLDTDYWPNGDGASD